MAKLFTSAEAALRLGIHPSAVRQLSARYEIGTLLNRRMRVYTEEDIVMLQTHSTGKAGRPRKLSDALAAAANEAESRIARSIKDGDPKAAELDIKVSGHLRRLAGMHRDSGNDPEQVGD